MFFGCQNLSDVQIFNMPASVINNMFRAQNSKALNIWTDPTTANNMKTAKLVSSSALTWTTITNGFYNSQYNIYIYSNGVDA